MNHTYRIRFLTFFISLVCFHSLLAQTEVGGIYYYLCHDMTAIVINDKSCSHDDHGCYSGNIVIPSTITYNGKSYTVTRISDYAFMDCKALTSVVIPSSITSIGTYAFLHCSNLRDVKIPNGVMKIESGTFSGCLRLKSITIPASVCIIGSKAFYGCSSLTSVTIPNSVNLIDHSAFENCGTINNVTILSKYIKLSNESFYGSKIKNFYCYKQVDWHLIGGGIYNIHYLDD